MIVGLYFNIVPFLIFVVLIYLLQTFIKNKYIRLIKLIITKNVLILFLVSFIFGICYVTYLEKIYDNIYKTLENVNATGTIISLKEEKDYSYQYKIKIEDINNKKVKQKIFFLSVPKNKLDEDLQYGDKIFFSGEYIKPEEQRNYKGFDYSRYLKTLKIYGTFKVNNKLKVIEKNNEISISAVANKLRGKMIANANILFPQKTKGIFLGILLGYTELISDEIKEEFSDSSLSHLLAVSGSHVSYIIFGLILFLKIIKMPKQASKIIASIFLIFYLYLTEFTPSVTRAVIMGIVVTMQTVLFRKQDTINTISLSLLFILVENPYKLFNIGFLLSYLGTIGIIILITQMKITGENKKTRIEKMVQYLKNLCVVTISAQILIFPIMVYSFNTISFTFVLSNLLAGILIGPITIVGFIILIFSFFSLPLTSIIEKFYNIFLIILLLITKFFSIIPISKIYVKTPSMILIIFYYLIITFIYLLIKIKKSERIYLKNKVNQIVRKVKSKMNMNKEKFLISLLLICMLCTFLKKIPQSLRIYFIDVGQGDSSLIVTPNNKTVLIDSGGSENYDVGKNTLLPYLLDRNIKKLDYILISHFDTDHCRGFEYLLDNIKIKNMIITKQTQVTENFQTIYKLAKKRKVNIITVKKGDNILLDKYSKIEILAPIEGYRMQDMNDSSIVAKITAFNFSILFTGDASQNIEEKLISDNTIDLSSTVLKVSHHGSKTGTSKAFIEKVNPKIALIGVGKNNLFAHPNKEVIERLEKNNIKIYRTDQMGEIEIDVNKTGKIRVKTMMRN